MLYDDQVEMFADWVVLCIQTVLLSEMIYGYGFWAHLILTSLLVGVVAAKLEANFDKQSHHEEVNKVKGTIDNHKHEGLQTDSHAKTCKFIHFPLPAHQ